MATFKRIKGMHAEKLQSFVTNYINEYMKDSVTPETAANHAINLTRSHSTNLEEVFKLLENPSMIKGRIL